jgi:hypothetical protein
MHQPLWRIWLLAVSVGAVCALLPSRVHAQTNTGEVEGRVIDAQGGVLPGAVGYGPSGYLSNHVNGSATTLTETRCGKSGSPPE